MTIRFLIPLLALSFGLTACGPMSDRRSAPAEAEAAAAEQAKEADDFAAPNHRSDAYDLGIAYRRNSCILRFNQGLAVTQVLPPRHIISGPFDKPYDDSRLRAVGMGSSKETYKFMLLDGVDVYSVPLVVRGGCPSMDELPRVSPELYKLWKNQNSPKMLGTHLPVNRARTAKATKPVIMIRQDADRYVLVHEYMHHVFNSVREETQNYHDENLLSDLALRSARYSSVDPLAVEDEENPKVLTEYLTAWADYIETSLTLLENFSLEELAVEDVLNQARESGLLSPVSDYNKKNSQVYMKNTFESGIREKLQGIADDSQKNFALAQLAGLSGLGTQILKLGKIAALRIQQADLILNRWEPLKLNLAAGVMSNDSQDVWRATPIPQRPTGPAPCPHLQGLKAELQSRGIHWPMADGL